MGALSRAAAIGLALAAVAVQPAHSVVPAAGGSAAAPPGSASVRARLLPVGRAEILVPVESAGGSTAMRVFTYRAGGYAPGRPVVVVVHGISRDAADYRDYWAPAAERAGALVVVPRLDRKHFRDFAESPSVTGRALLAAFTEAESAAGGGRGGFRLFGHSAGAQAVHRLILAGATLPIERAVAANAGWYTFPTLDVAWPYGLAGTLTDAGGLAAAFRRPLVVMLGLADDDPNHPRLRRTAEAMAEGATRLARGRAFFQAARAAAAGLHVAFVWRLLEVPGVAHDGRAMSEAAAAILLDPALP